MKLVITLYATYEYPPREIKLEAELPEVWDSLDDWEQREKCWEIARQDLRLSFEVKE